jgi:hypothetical protein
VRWGFCGLGRSARYFRVLLPLGLLVAVGTGALRISGPQLAAPTSAQSGAVGSPIWMQSDGRQQGQVPLLYAHLPVVFERNQGQTDAQVKFLARGVGYGLFLTQNEAVLALQRSHGRSGDRPSLVRMGLANANASPVLTGTGQLPGTSNYFVGNDPAKWPREVPQFARVRYNDVYPGVDLIYYGKQGQLEYDFELAPGSDPNRVVLQFGSLQNLTIDNLGDVVLAEGANEVRLEAPRAFQVMGGEQLPVASRFVLRGPHQVGFELGPYDRSRALVIDPVLTYSTYLGGSGDEACPARIAIGPVLSTPLAGCPAIAVDSAFNMYVAGSTTSADFPPAGTPFQPSRATAPDVFVAKLNSQGSALVFSTYLGGDGTDFTAGLAINGASNVVVAGSTDSTDFPTGGSTSPFQGTAASAGQHAFVSELSPDGKTLVYSTYLSGGGTDTATGLALDATGKIYVSGITTSGAMHPPNFPTTTGAFQTGPASPSVTNQFFMSKIDPTQSGVSSLAYSTYIGGSNPSSGVALGGGIAVDSNASAPNVYLTGGTDFTNMPVLNAAQGTNAAGSDAWVAKFTPTNAPGTQEIYLTYLGGAGTDVGTAVAVDGSGQAYVTGYTDSSGITAPSGTTPFEEKKSGGIDAFLFKIGGSIPSGQTAYPINYFSYLGGLDTDVGLSVAVDSLQGARIAGWTTSGDLPLNAGVNPPFQGALAGPVDAFVSRVDTTATSATAAGHSGTYLGGSGSDFGTSIAADVLGNTYVTGETSSGNFPPGASNPLRPNLNGTTDAFVGKLGPRANLKFSPVPTKTPATVGIGNAVAFKYNITNSGDFVSNGVFTDFLGGGTVTVPGSCAQNSSMSSGTLVCSLGTLNAGQTTSITINVTATTAGTLENSAQLGVGSATTDTASVSASVTDFSIDVSPKTASVEAGVPASFTVTATPSVTGPDSFPNSVSISCSSGLPTGATCTFPNNASISNLNNGAQTRQLVINTTARVTTPANLFRRDGPVYATWLPITGLAIFGAGIARRSSCRRRLLFGALAIAFIGLVSFQAGCSSSKSTSTTTGTPAGDYSITVSATSGSAPARTQQIVLTVQ